MAKAVAIKQESFFNKNKLLIAILGVVFLVFANTLSNDYCMDDEIVTIHHPLTSKGIAAIPEILKSPYFKADIYSYEYRPVVHISFAIEHQFLGESAAMSHFINLLLYLILVMVAFNLLRQLFPAVNELILAIIILLFALHPTHTEVVASIKNRDEILALLFTFLAFQQAIKFCVTDQWWRILTALLFFNVAMGSKVTVLPFALVIPLSISVLLKPSQAFKLLLLAFLLPLTASLWIETFSLKQQILLMISTVMLTWLSNLKSWSLMLDKITKLIRFHYSPQERIHKAEENGYELKRVKDFMNLLKENLLPLLVLIIINIGIFFFPLQPLTLTAPMVILAIMALFVRNDSQLHFLLLYLAFYCWQLLFFVLKESSGITMFYGVLLAGIIGRLKIVHPLVFLTFVIPYLFNKLFIPMLPLSLWSYSYFLLENRNKTLRRIITFLHFCIAFFPTVIYAVLFFSSTQPFDANIIINFWLSLVVVFLPQIVSRVSKKRFVVGIIMVFAALSFYEFKTSALHKELFSKEMIATSQKLIETSPAPKIVPTASYRPVLFAEFPIAEFPQPLEKKVSLSAVALLKYLKLTFIPYPLAFYYGYKEVEVLPLLSFSVVVSLVLHLLLVVGMVYFYKRNTLIAFGIGFYLIVISPFSTFFYPIPGVIADRYLFAPTLGFAIALIGFLAMVFKVDVYAKQVRFSTVTPTFKYLLSAVLVCYSLLSIARNTDWKDRLTLFRNDIKHVENSAQAHNLLAFHLTMETQKATTMQERTALLEEAVFHFKRATEIWPEFMNATYDLGRDLEQLGRWREAIDAYHRTFQIDSTFSDAILRAGIVYENLPNLDSAIICYEFVTKQNPLNAVAFNNLSFIYFKQKNFNKAIAVCKEAYAANPQNTDPLINIGKTFVNMNQTDSAIFYLEKAYQMRKGDAGLVQMLYQLWNEKKTEPAKTQYYFGELQKMGLVR